MTVFEKWIQGITAGIAGLTFVWGIISIFIVHRQNKSLAILQGKADKGIYVSKVVFDRVFLEFKNLSKCLFENYNNACTKLFPVIDQVLCFLKQDQKVEKMQEYYNESMKAVNNLVQIIQTNRFIFPNKLIINLEKFENEIKGILQVYDDKIRDTINGNNLVIGLVTLKTEQEYVKKSSELSDLFQTIEKEMKEYIESLQVIEK